MGNRSLVLCGDASGAPTLANARGSRQRDPARPTARSFRSQANCAVFSAMAAVLDPCAKATLPSFDSAPRISIMPEAAASTDVGTSFGKYFLMKKLAAGGMGEVFLAKQQGPAGFQKMLVVKKILSHLTESKEFVEAFLGEARLAAQMNHRNIVQVFELGEQDGAYRIGSAARNRQAVKRSQRSGIVIDLEAGDDAVASGCRGDRTGYIHIANCEATNTRAEAEYDCRAEGSGQHCLAEFPELHAFPSS